VISLSSKYVAAVAAVVAAVAVVVVVVVDDDEVVVMFEIVLEEVVVVVFGFCFLYDVVLSCWWGRRLDIICWLCGAPSHNTKLNTKHSKHLVHPPLHVNTHNGHQTKAKEASILW